VRQVKAYLNRCGLPEEILFPPPYLAAHHNELADMGKVLLGPKVGLDFAGLVRQVGDGVSKFAVGDEVYGDCSRLSGGIRTWLLMLAALPRCHAASPTRSRLPCLPYT